MSAPPVDPSSLGAHPWVAAGRDRVRFGLMYGHQLDQPPDWGALVGFFPAAEALGYDSYWTADHPIFFADCESTLTLAARATHSIRLGPLVACVSYRHPALTARLAADLDQLSGGRLGLGLGTGDNPDEFAQLGLPFPPPRERQATLAEAVAVITGLWAAGRSRWRVSTSGCAKRGWRPGRCSSRACPSSSPAAGSATRCSWWRATAT